MERKQLTAQERQKSEYYELNHMIYYDLPILLGKIIHAAFAYYECLYPVTCENDMQYIEGYIEEIWKIFNIIIEGHKKQIIEMLKMHENRGGQSNANNFNH